MNEGWARPPIFELLREKKNISQHRLPEKAGRHLQVTLADLALPFPAVSYKNVIEHTKTATS